MKHYIFYSFAFAGILGLAACSQNEDVTAPEGDGVTFSIKLPKDMSTRGTFGDGTDAGDRATLNNLQWSVFEVAADGSQTLVFSDQKSAFGASQTEETVNIPLAKGKTYQVAFYADDSTNNFATYQDGALSVDYSKAASNTAAEDAFIGKSEVFSVTGAYAETVTLTRPFAQLNWGTDDLDTTVVKNILASLTGTVSVSNGLYSSMNIISGEVSNEVSGVEFGAVNLSDLPSQTFPVADYSLIAMNYLLTGDGTIDCQLAFNNGLSAVNVNAAPVKTNFRTNIYGSLLTAPADFNIIVDNNFDNPDFEIKTINSAASLRDAIASAADGDYIKLDAPANGDFDLSGETLNVNADVTIEVPANVTVKTSRTNDAANIIVGEGKTLNLVGEGTLSGDNRIVDINGTLVVDGPTFITSTPNKGSAITVNHGGTLEFNSGNVNAANCALYVEGDVTLNGGEISSSNSSSNPEVGTGWSYAVRVFSGASFDMNGGVVKGTQGALASVGGAVTVNDGLCYTVNSEQWGNDAFYAIYATSDNNEQGHVYINGGYFYAPNDRSPKDLDIEGTSCVMSGDDDTGKELGSVEIKGGYFSGKPYFSANNNSGLIALPQGFSFEACNVTKDGMTFTWTVKK